MRSLLGLAGALALGFSTIAATAMPIDASLGGNTSAVSQVAYGCGYGMTRGPAGRCRPKFTCPRGWHPGPHGFHCFRNRY